MTTLTALFAYMLSMSPDVHDAYTLLLFLQSCLDTWLSQQARCPVCQTSCKSWCSSSGNWPKWECLRQVSCTILLYNMLNYSSRTECSSYLS
jgi:hypothetical protein